MKNFFKKGGEIKSPKSSSMINDDLGFVSQAELGDLAKDKITGFTGVVECISYWLNSCRRVTLKPITLKDGMVRDSNTFDGPQIEVVEAGYYTKPKIKSGNKTGGPAFEPVMKDDVR